MVDNFGVTGSEKSFNIVNHLSEYFPAAVNIVVGCPAGCPLLASACTRVKRGILEGSPDQTDLIFIANDVIL